MGNSDEVIAALLHRSSINSTASSLELVLLSSLPSDVSRALDQHLHGWSQAHGSDRGGAGQGTFLGQRASVCLNSVVIHYRFELTSLYRLYTNA